MKALFSVRIIRVLFLTFCALILPSRALETPSWGHNLVRALSLPFGGGGKEAEQGRTSAVTPSKMPVTPTTATIDPLKCMGDWYVQVAIPTPFDSAAHNGLEQYEWDDKEKRIKVKYTFNDGSFTGKQTVVYQKGRINPSSANGSKWQVKPWLACFYAPFWLDYYVVDIDTKDYSYIVASSPETSGMLAWMYIMTRQKNVSEEFLVPLRAAAAEAGWDMSKAQRVPQSMPQGKQEL